MEDDIKRWTAKRKTALVILRFRHLLEEHGLGQQIQAAVNAKLIDRSLMLNSGTVVDASLISALS